MLDGRAVVSMGSKALSDLHPGDQFGGIALCMASRGEPM
jgi:hypothetical protein